MNVQRREGLAGQEVSGPRMRHRWRRGSAYLIAGVAIVVIGAACGETPEPLAAVSTVEPVVASPSDAVATPRPVAACWSEEQRMEGDEMPQQFSEPPAMRIDSTKTYTGTLETNKGPIEVEFYPEDAPVTVNNFVCLAEFGFYDQTPFHRILKGFVIQGGDPTGTGTGSPGYRFADEAVVKEYERGIMAMANSGPNTNGSQFFIVLGDLRQRLPKNYTIFGRVTGGLDVVDAIADTPTRVGRSGENSTPTEPVMLERVTISES
jgi:cyclophilin family peptidyl-prolyl cis-trans isomerase